MVGAGGSGVARRTAATGAGDGVGEATGVTVGLGAGEVTGVGETLGTTVGEGDTLGLVVGVGVAHGKTRQTTGGAASAGVEVKLTAAIAAMKAAKLSRPRQS